MAGRSIVIVGSVVAGLLVSAPAWAVSADLDHGGGGGGGGGGPQAPASQNKDGPAYSFSGNGFHLSISRTDDDDDEPRGSAGKPAAAPRERSLFDRLLHTIEDIFGD